MKPFLSIVIPVAGEDKQLPLLLFDADRRLKSLGCSFEIVVANNNSGDGTAEMLQKIGAFLPSLRIVNGREGRKKSYAVKAGMLGAKGSYHLLLGDGEGASIEKFNGIIRSFKEGYDIVAARGGLLCFSEEASAKIFRLLSRDGRGFRFESLVLAELLGLKIKELPPESVRAAKRLPGVEDIIDMLAVKLNVWFKRYPR